MSPLSAHKRSGPPNYGEDGIIESVFKTIGTRNKWCVEFGAIDGVYGSNSWNLITNHGWSAVLVECHLGYFKKLLKTHEGNKKVHSFNAYVNFEGDDTLDAILSRTDAPKDIDFVCIDIDGADYHIWDSLKNYEPRAVMIECNLRIPPDISFISPRKLALGPSSSLKALVELGKKKGYELVFAEDMNALFVRKELFPKFGISDNFPSAIGVFSEQEARFFQGLDGSVVLYGIPPEKLFLFKKKPASPLSILKNGHLTKVPVLEKKFLRFLKTYAKKMPGYYTFAERRIARMYGKRWKKRRAALVDTPNKEVD